jgi:hypothetical protein
MRTATRAFVLVLAIGLATPAARTSALEVYGNPGLGNAGQTLNNAGIRGLAQGFKVGSTDWTLQSIDIGLKLNTPAPSNATATLALFADSGSNSPGSSVLTFDLNNPSPAYVLSNSGLYNFTGSYTLEATKTYWLVMTITSTPIFDWYYADGGAAITPTAQNGSGFSYVGTQRSTTVPLAWTAIPGSVTGLRITINAVPEPSTYALGGVAALVLGAAARRKTLKAATA